MHPINRSFIISLLITVVSPLALLAQDASDARLYQLRDSVLIVASRYASPLSREANSIVVIDGKDITRIADHSILEMLKWQVPSAFVLQTRVGGYGVGTAGTGAVYLRGMGGKPNTGIAMLVDGHPDFMGIFGHPLPDAYGMEDVERVDVLLGPASTVFGSNALGGVINLVTSDASRNLLRVSAEGGSWGTYSTTLGASRVFGDHGVQLTLGRNGTDGHIAQTSFTGMRVQAGYDWKFSDAWRLSFRGRHVPFTFDDPTRSTDPAGLGTYGNIKRNMGQIILHNRTGDVQGSTQIYLNSGHHEFADGFVSDDQAYGLSSYQQWRLASSVSVAMGTDLISYGGKTNVDNKEYSLQTAGIYALAMYSPLDILHLRAGMRYQYHSLELNSLAPSAGVSVTPIGGLRVFANVQSGFRHPTPRELYLFPPANASLREEKTLGYEAGAEYLLPEGSLRVAWFRTDATDLIATVANPSPPPPMRNLNVLDVQMSGLEVSAQYRILPYLLGRVSWSGIEPGDFTAYNPSQQFKYMLTLLAGPIHGSIAGQYVHELFAGNKNTLPLADYHTLDVTLSWITPWGVEPYLKGRNILDRTYNLLPGYAAPGVHFLAGFRYAFEG
ncbi:MAG: TonB-dependent receptor [Bacteroidia bacterium]|nr:TonB-dependent receptor [Bacteroidia bacterium]